MKEISGATGEVCKVSGIYCCVTLGHGEIVIREGDLFPPCFFDDGHDTMWVLRKEVKEEKK